MRIVLFLILMLLTFPAHAEDKEYLYYRDVTITAFQNLREFFNLPNRPQNYEITLISDAIGPLTFTVIRVEDDKETILDRSRSYRIGDHNFHIHFKNPEGHYDLIVEMANSNPAGSANVSVIVVEEHE